MATCIVSGVLKDPSETAIEDVIVRAYLVRPYFSTTVHIAPMELSTSTDSNGAWSLTLNQGGSFIISIEYPPNDTNSKIKYNYSITIPASATADFSSLATEL